MKNVASSNAWDLDRMLSQEISDLNRDTAVGRVKEAVIIAKPDPNQIRPDNDSDDENQTSNSKYYYYDDDDDYEEDLAIRDPELFAITESNRQIGVDPNPTASQTHRLIRRPPELNFSEPPVLFTKDDYIQVSFYYGQSKEREVKRSKQYMIMCDFGSESNYACQWALGTLLRNGDEIHIASVVTTEEDVDDMDDDEKYKLWAEVRVD
jgi:hypothetical protein